MALFSYTSPDTARKVADAALADEAGWIGLVPTAARQGVRDALRGDRPWRVLSQLNAAHERLVELAKSQAARVSARAAA